MATSSRKRILSILCILTLLLGMVPMSASAAGSPGEFTAAGWFETLYAEIDGISVSDVKSVAYTGAVDGDSGAVSGTLTPDGEGKEDFEFLVRTYNGGVRVDIPGVPAGTYTLTVETEDTTYTKAGIEVQAYDRSGYAHYDPTTADKKYAEGVGAYKNDGTLKDGAKVIYVTKDNVDSVTLPDADSPAGIGNILGYDAGDGHNQTMQNLTYPLVVRIIGDVPAPEEGLTQPKESSPGKDDGDNGYMVSIVNANNLTIEGVGPGATIDGWGISYTNNNENTVAKNFEVRNLAFRNVPEDCLGINGQDYEKKRVEHCWVHNCSFYVPHIENPMATDKAQGDGACDFKLGQYFTMSYNYFEGYHKTNLVGGGPEQLQYNITWHHNWYKNCESRSPLARQANMHIYNCLFEGQTSYVMNTRANAYIFSEYNTFIGCKNPVQNGDGKSEQETEGTGAVKSFHDILTNCSGDNTAVVVASKGDESENVTLPDNPNANFENDAEKIYSGYALDEDNATAQAKVRAYAGPIKAADAPAAGTSYTFYAISYGKQEKDNVAIETGTKVGDGGFFTVTGSNAVWRVKSTTVGNADYMSTSAIDLGSKASSSLDFKVPEGYKAQSVTIVFASTGGSNYSAVGILKGTAAVNNTDGNRLDWQKSTSSKSASYTNLPEGTYSIVAPKDVTPEEVGQTDPFVTTSPTDEQKALNPNQRGVRIYSVEVVLAPADGSTESVTSLTLNKNTAEIEIGATETLKATVEPEGSLVKWTSSDLTVATVSGGVVTGVAAGSAIITAEAGGMSASCAVTVTDPASETLTLTLAEDSVTVEKDKTAEVAVTEVTEGAEISFSYNPQNIATAAYDYDGTNKKISIEGKAKGDTVITVTASKSGSADATATIAVKVTDGESPDDPPVVTPVTHTFDATQQGAQTADKVKIADGTKVGDDGFFTVTGDNTAVWRTKSSSDFSATASLELGKNRNSAIEFTVDPGAEADATIEFSSTGSSNYSALILLLKGEETDEVVRVDADNRIAWTNTSSPHKTVEYKGLEPGTYKITVPGDVEPGEVDLSEFDTTDDDEKDNPNARGTRIFTITVEIAAKSSGGEDDVPVESVTLNQTSATIKPGATLTLTATVLPENATDQTVVWTTSDAGVATVSGGIVTAVAEGSATITATVGGKSAECAVTVTEGGPAPAIKVPTVTAEADNAGNTAYDGLPHGIVVTVKDVNGNDITTQCTITYGANEAAEAADQDAFKITDVKDSGKVIYYKVALPANGNYEFAENVTGSGSATVTITKAAANITVTPGNTADIPAAGGTATFTVSGVPTDDAPVLSYGGKPVALTKGGDGNYTGSQAIDENENTTAKDHVFTWTWTDTTGNYTDIAERTITIKQQAASGGSAGGDSKPATDAEKAALKTAIDNARASASGVEISENGKDVLTSKKWVTREVMNTLSAAIDAAEKVYNDKDATQAGVNAQIAALNQAKAAFEAEKASGTKTNASSGGSASGGGSSGSGSTGGGSGSTTGGSTTTTTTAQDGTTTTTTTAQDGTKTETVTKTDGSKIETVTKTDGSKTETVTEADGTVTETVTETNGTKTETVKETDGTTTETVTKTDGTKTETVTEPDGTVTATKTKADGAKTETVKEAGGDVTVTATDARGEVVAKVEIPAVIPALETKFEDVPTGHWAESAVNTMAALGVIQGVSNDGQTATFDMDADITRGAMAQILFNLSNGAEGKIENFGDVAEGEWYTNAIAWAADAGIVEGYTNGNFGPEDAITREQLAVMLYRYANLLGLDTEAEADITGFSDNDSVSPWAAKAMNWAVNSGIITGKGNSTLDPSSSATRAETAVMFNRFLALV